MMRGNGIGVGAGHPCSFYTYLSFQGEFHESRSEWNSVLPTRNT